VFCREDFVSAWERLTSHEAQKEAAPKEPSRTPGMGKSCDGLLPMLALLAEPHDFALKLRLFPKAAPHLCGPSLHAEQGCSQAAAARAAQKQNWPRRPQQSPVDQANTWKKYQ